VIIVPHLESGLYAKQTLHILHILAKVVCMYLLAYLGLFALQVENFKYLGMNVNESNQRSTEIQKRIQAANNPY
jgi:hypothetical protein